MREKQNTKLYRFRDLKELGIAPNRVTLGRWIAARRFPAPIRLGPNSVAWLADEVNGHLERLAQERLGVAT